LSIHIFCDFSVATFLPGAILFHVRNFSTNYNLAIPLCQVNFWRVLKTTKPRNSKSRSLHEVSTEHRREKQGKPRKARKGHENTKKNKTISEVTQRRTTQRVHESTKRTRRHEKEFDKCETKGTKSELTTEGTEVLEAHLSPASRVGSPDPIGSIRQAVCVFVSSVVSFVFSSFRASVVCFSLFLDPLEESRYTAIIASSEWVAARFGRKS